MGKIRHNTQTKCDRGRAKFARAQGKSLKSKDAIIRGGVRAVRLRETSPSATVRIIKGEIVVKDQEKIFEYIAVPANQDAINAAAKELFDRYNNITVWLWTINGRISAGANSYTQWFNEFGTKLNEYSKIKLWVTGLAYTKFK